MILMLKVIRDKDIKKEDNERNVTLFLGIFFVDYSETTVKGTSTDTSLCNFIVAL